MTVVNKAPAKPSRAAQETEDLALDEQTVRAGAEAVLRDPAKGSYFVVTVR
jgi:hypothetical protein